MLLPIIMICVCALLGGGTLIFLKLSAKHKKSKNKDKEELAQITANEFVNVKDIRGNFLYTRDNLALAYLKIYPISTELFSKNEKRLIAKQLTVSLSSAQYPFQLLAVSRPVDISPLLSELSATLTSSSDVKQKELLKQEIVEMGAFALSGEVVERQFYIKIWDRVSDGVERDLLQKLKLLGGYFSDSGIQTEILAAAGYCPAVQPGQQPRLCAFGGFRHQCCDPDFGKCRCCLSMKHTRQDLKIMQGWSLERKIRVTQTRIMEWYMRYDGQVFISFSGGKDSTVLLDLARRVYPDIPAVYVDTGLEYPELRDFVKTKDNVIWLRPRYPFTQILEKYGYPIISKEVSDVINGARKGQPYRLARLNGELLDKNGKKSIYNCENYKYLLDAPFKISARCCYHMKKAPLNKFERQSGRHPITGVLACESKLREQSWIKFGCNGFERQRPLSQPLAFWLEEDILRYLKMTGIPYAPIYGDIVESRKKNGTPILKTTGVSRSGCMYCMYGVHLEHEPNRFQLMQVTHPQQYDYCINKLGCGAVLDYIGVPYRNQQLEVDHC